MAPTPIRSGASEEQIQPPPPEANAPTSPTPPGHLNRQALLAWLGVWLGLSLAFEWTNAALTKGDPTPGVTMSWIYPLLEHPYRSSLGIALILGAIRGRGRVPRGMK